MSDDSDKPESGAREGKRPKIKAEDNPWYLLATLYGVSKSRDDELQAKNRVAWNRYFAANLDEESRASLIEEKRHPAEELTPLSPEELQEVATAFAERRKAPAKKLALPASDAEIDFSNVKFEQDAFFYAYLFSGSSLFRGATFSGLAGFDYATFSEGAHFGRTAFSGWADFDGAAFSDTANFAGAAFSGWAAFGGAAFPDAAYFFFATFAAEAHFNGATFSAYTKFHDAIFFDEARFAGATFSFEACFQRAKFLGPSSFINMEVNGETSFEKVIFDREPPKFFGAKLHQGTVWRGITWPPHPKDKDRAGAFIDAYACLKLEMDRLKKHEDELNFFALELQSRRVWLGTWAGLPIAIYGTLSDCGRSYLRPLVALFYLALTGTLAFLPSNSLSPWQSLGLSVANTLNVFGFRKDFFDAATIEHLPALLKILAAAQTILGTILLFLFGLGIRNKFRMK